MNTYISILRGINVSGKNIIKMDALRQMYADLEFSNIQTYIQSGNVIFRCHTTDTIKLKEKIRKKILVTFNYEVPVLVLEVSELKEVINKNPFVTKTNIDVAHLHVTFLSSIPSNEDIDLLFNNTFVPDEFEVIGKTVYLHCPAGYGNTKLSNTFFERKLSVEATTRNWKTCNELLSIAQQP